MFRRRKNALPKNFINFEYSNGWNVFTFKILFGLLRVQFLAHYFSEPLISGFVTAAAVHVLFSQIDTILGFTRPKSGGVGYLFGVSSIEGRRITREISGNSGNSQAHSKDQPLDPGDFCVLLRIFMLYEVLSPFQAYRMVWKDIGDPLRIDFGSFRYSRGT